ncbi:MAG: hypothetical protein K1X92_17215 [Bacteroidia bacterium]|nr:hypothetical protein [Bacteroidia bacterium]
MKNILTSIFIVLTFLTLNAQVGMTTLELDFQNKIFDSTSLKAIQKLKTGDWYQLKITGINMNLYKVNFEKKDSVFPKNTDNYGFDVLDLSKLTQLIAGIIPASTNIPSEEGFNLTESLSPNDKSARPFSTADPISQKLGEELTILINFSNELVKQNIEIDAINLNIVKSILNSKSLEEKKCLDEKDACGIMDDITTRRKELITLSGKVMGAEILYLEFSAKNGFTAIEKDEKNHKKTDEYIKKAYTEIKNALGMILTNINAENVTKKLTPLIMIENNNKGEYLSLPQQFTGDIGVMKIEILPKDTMNLPSFRTRIVFPENRQYVGSGVSFYLSGLYDEAFSIVKKDSGEYRVFEEQPAKSEIGTAVLFRYGCKFKKTLGGHLTFGPGVSLSQKIKPRVMFGGGLSLGKKHMFVGDIGAVAGYR